VEISGSVVATLFVAFRSRKSVLGPIGTGVVHLPDPVARRDDPTDGESATSSGPASWPAVHLTVEDLIA
jgi:hypothetical protein